MNTRFSRPLVIFLLAGLHLSLPQESAHCQNTDFKGQLSSGFTLNFNTPIQALFSLRYIPEFSSKFSLSKQYSLDFIASLNAYGTVTLGKSDDGWTYGKLKPYRLWLRFSAPQFEVRIGLQKINFGSAMFLRPLMWFDRIDPRDPLQITDGVCSLLFRYYFLNNANIWLWSLYGNDKLKGWEVIPTKKKSVEYGGRIQHPFLKGEIALTYHHRCIDLSKGIFSDLPLDETLVPENRLALDGRWDIGIGLWFEGTLIHRMNNELPVEYNRALTVGADYTFGWGNGLNVITEHFFFESSKTAFGSGEGGNFSSLTLNYPLGLTNRLSAMFYFDWKNHDLYSFLNWTCSFDNLRIYIIGFCNPEQNQLYQFGQDSNLFTGKGTFLMVVLHH